MSAHFFLFCLSWRSGGEWCARLSADVFWNVSCELIPAEADEVERSQIVGLRHVAPQIHVAEIELRHARQQLPQVGWHLGVVNAVVGQIDGEKSGVGKGAQIHVQEEIVGNVD